MAIAETKASGLFLNCESQKVSGCAGINRNSGRPWAFQLTIYVCVKKAHTVGAMYLAGEDCVVQGDLVILVGLKHGEKAAVQSRRSDVSQKTRSGGGGGELRL